MIIFSPQDTADIIQYYQTHTKKETAKHFNITPKILDRILRENQIPHHLPKILSKQEEQQICELYSQHTAAFLHNMFHVRKSRIEKILIKNGYTLHSKEEDAKLSLKDRQNTTLEHYGVLNPNQSPKIREQISQTNLNKYGTVCPANTPQSKEQQFKNKEQIIKKRKSTCLDKYGVENYCNTEAYWKSRKQTCIEKYGAEEWTQSDYFYQSYPGKFWCDNISFDSLPELAVYLYFVVHNLPIERPKVVLKYYSIDGEHTYHPDFQINGKLVEVKGDHFFKDGILINPYSNLEKDQQIAKDKWQCMLQNDIEVWTKTKYKMYVEWFHSMNLDKENFRAKTANSNEIKRSNDKDEQNQYCDS